MTFFQREKKRKCFVIAWTALIFPIFHLNTKKYNEKKNNTINSLVRIISISDTYHLSHYDINIIIIYTWFITVPLNVDSFAEDEKHKINIHCVSLVRNVLIITNDKPVYISNDRWWSSDYRHPLNVIQILKFCLHFN